MFKFKKSVAAAVIAFASAGLAYAPSASADPFIPLTLTQQGRLLDNMGAPVDGVSLTFTFSLYTTPTAGTAVWTENQSITPDGGYFSAKLGEATPFSAGIFDGSQPTLYLGIKIGSDTEMTPRQELTSVPFALLAANALNAAHADNATNSGHAATADNATRATAAGTVDKITPNVSSGTASTTSGGTSVSATCPAGFPTPTGGGCTNLSAGTTLNSAGFDLSKGFSCVCNQACNVEAEIICVK